MQTLGYLLLGLIVGGLAGFLYGTRKVGVWAVEVDRLRAELDRSKRVHAMVPGIYDYTTRAMREQRANL